jgi:acetyltransferase-like isoleucine patch superfamily enzyme
MIRWLVRLLITQTWWKLRMGSLGWRTVVYPPMLISNARRIFIGSRSQVRDFARLEVISRPACGWIPKLSIGDRVNIEQGVHIVCQCEVSIGDDVSITPYCAIVDTYHPYSPPDKTPKIGARLPDVPTFVRIGSGSFLGIRAVVLPNVNIGRGCVIGAGSVVTRDIPDYSVAAGVPARVLATYDSGTSSWTRLDRE